MVADRVDGVIGVDTHAETHTAAACRPTGAVISTAVCATTGPALEELLAFGTAAVPGRRVWAVEGCGSYGAGLAAMLLASGEEVVEVERPKRTRRRGQDKNDAVDAIRAARDALASNRPATPKQAVPARVLASLLAVRASAIEARTAATNLLHALLTTAPTPLRDALRGHRGAKLVDACWALTDNPELASDPTTKAAVTALATTAERIMFLSGEIHGHDAALAEQVTAVVPQLLACTGVGPVSAGQLVVSYGHHGRVHGEAAFAHLGGVAPIEASSGKTVRHRLNRGGDRALNRALHTIAKTRMRHDPTTIAYVERRRAEGKTDREIERCLTRYLARQMFRLLRHAELAA